MKVLLLSAAFLGVAAVSRTPAVKVDHRISEISDYSHWAQATKDAVMMTPRLWLLCRPPTPAEQKELDEFNMKSPHSNGYLRVYMNPSASDPLLKGKTFPPGATLVKEKLVGPDSGLIARAVMVKHEKGYSPSTGDWEFYVVSKDMQVETAKTADCVSCHSSQAQADWVYRSYLTSRMTR